MYIILAFTVSFHCRVIYYPVNKSFNNNVGIHVISFQSRILLQSYVYFIRFEANEPDELTRLVDEIHSCTEQTVSYLILPPNSNLEVLVAER